MWQNLTNLNYDKTLIGTAWRRKYATSWHSLNKEHPVVAKKRGICGKGCQQIRRSQKRDLFHTSCLQIARLKETRDLLYKVVRKSRSHWKTRWIFERLAILLSLYVFVAMITRRTSQTLPNANCPNCPYLLSHLIWQGLRCCIMEPAQRGTDIVRLQTGSLQSCLGDAWICLKQIMSEYSIE